MKRQSTASASSKNLVTLPKRGGHDPVTETSQIRRQSLPGPSKISDIQNKKFSSADVPTDADLEKQIVISLKKAPKEVTSIEGKITIISQM